MTLRALLLAIALVPAAAGARSRSSDERSRQSAEMSPGFRLGSASAVRSAASDTLTTVGGGGYLLFDIPGLLVDVAADIYAGDGARFISVGPGAYFPFSPGESTPYLGGGMKIGWSKFGGDGAFGLHPFATAGVLLGRSWRPQIRFELSYFLTTGTERRAPGAEARRASGPVATFGLGF